MASVLKIHSSSISSYGFGHSWIEYCPVDGISTTYGTWGNNPTGDGNGLLQNVEPGSMVPDVTRVAIIDPVQEKRLFELIDEYRKLGKQAWTVLTPCSSFAAHAWEVATSERLLHQSAFISNPSTLAQSISEANARDVLRPRNAISDTNTPSPERKSSSLKKDLAHAKRGKPRSHRR